MKHVIFGGDGFVGRHLAKKLVADGEEVVVAEGVVAFIARGEGLVLLAFNKGRVA